MFLTLTSRKNQGQPKEGPKEEEEKNYSKNGDSINSAGDSCSRLLVTVGACRGAWFAVLLREQVLCEPYFASFDTQTYICMISHTSLSHLEERLLLLLVVVAHM